MVLGVDTKGPQRGEVFEYTVGGLEGACATTVYFVGLGAHIVRREGVLGCSSSCVNFLGCCPDGVCYCIGEGEGGDAL